MGTDISDNGIKVKSTMLRHLCDINKSTLDRWIWQGIFVPSEEGQGSGKHRQYTFSDIMICHLIADLNRSGIRLAIARDISQQMSLQLQSSLNDLRRLGWLCIDLIDPQHCKIVQPQEFDLSAPYGERLLMVNLKEIAQKIKLAIV